MNILTEDFVRQEVALGKSLKSIAKEQEVSYESLWRKVKKWQIELPNHTRFRTVNLTDQIFTRLTVKKLAPKSEWKGTQAHWTCECECGNIKVVRSSHLTDGSTKSCGCYHKDNNYKGFKDLSGTFWRHIQSNCKTRRK